MPICFVTRISSLNFRRRCNFRLRSGRGLGLVRTVEYQLGDLAALNSRSVCAFRGALELESDVADVHLTQSFLAKVAQLGSVKDG